MKGKEIVKKESTAVAVAGKVTKITMEEYCEVTGIGASLSDTEKKAFFAKAIKLNLDPFEKEIHPVPFKKFVGYDDKGEKQYKQIMEFITGYQVYLQRAETHPAFGGWYYEVIGDKSTIGVKVYILRTDRPAPFNIFPHTVRTCNVKLNTTTWNSNAPFMTMKVAVCQGLRLAFPLLFKDIPYTSDELWNKSMAEESEKLLNHPALNKTEVIDTKVVEEKIVAKKAVLEPPERPIKEEVKKDIKVEALKEVLKPKSDLSAVTVEFLNFIGKNKLKERLKELTKNDNTYYNILENNGVAHANQVKDRDQGRAIIAEIKKTIEDYKKENKK